MSPNNSTNPHRNEVEIPFDGVTYKCAPTFEAIAGAENTFKKSVFVIGQEVANFMLGATQLSTLALIALRTSGDPRFAKMTVKEVFETISMSDGGFGSITGPISIFCIRAFSGPSIVNQDEVQLPEVDPSL